jgi:hypothetical protein
MMEGLRDDDDIPSLSIKAQIQVRKMRGPLPPLARTSDVGLKIAPVHYWDTDIR